MYFNHLVCFVCVRVPVCVFSFFFCAFLRLNAFTIVIELEIVMVTVTGTLLAYTNTYVAEIKLLPRNVALMSSTLRRRRVESRRRRRCEKNSQLAHDDCRRIRSTIWKLTKQTP